MYNVHICFMFSICIGKIIKLENIQEFSELNAFLLWVDWHTEYSAQPENKLLDA